MVFIIKPISAQIIHDQDFISKMDPYCICIIGNQKKKTKPNHGGGKNPQWYDTLQFQSNQPFMKVQIYDNDLIKDDFIGQGTANLGQLMSNPGMSDNQYIDLIYHGKKAGRVLISMEYQGPAQGGWGNNTNQSGWVNQGNSNWGNNPNQGGFGYDTNQGNNGWGNNPNQGGWGNNPNQGEWGNQGNNGWGNNPNQGGWGNNPNNGW